MKGKVLAAMSRVFRGNSGSGVMIGGRQWSVRWAGIVLGSLAVVFAGAGVGGAAALTSSPAYSYTACLSSTGQLYNVAEGTNPSAACKVDKQTKAADKTVHLGGLASITSGAGLSVSGGGSDATVGITNGGVDTAQLADGAVATAKIADGAITTSKESANAGMGVSNALTSITVQDVNNDGIAEGSASNITSFTLNVGAGHQVLVTGQLTLANYGAGNTVPEPDVHTPLKVRSPSGQWLAVPGEISSGIGGGIHMGSGQERMTIPVSVLITTSETGAYTFSLNADVRSSAMPFGASGTMVIGGVRLVAADLGTAPTN